MPTGNPNSTLLSELNRLANGGTYPPVNTLDEAAAARAWAEREEIVLTTTDTVGVLNEIAGLPRGSWLDYSGVCNYLAGTTGLPAAAALRQLTGTPQVPTPGAPLLLIATPGNESVTINWAPPADEGDAPVDKYRITVVDHPEFTPIETTFNPFTFTGLANGTLYFFTVEAHNSFGWGPAATSPGATPAFVEYAAVPVTVEIPGETYPSSTVYYSAFCNPGGNAYNAGYRQNPQTGICAHPGYGDPFFPSDTVTMQVCNSGNDTLNGNTCTEPPTFETTYTCPNGGLLNPTTNMCVESYSAVYGIVNTTYGPRNFFVSDYGSSSAAYAAAAEVCSQPIYGNWSPELGEWYNAANCATYTYGYTCPYGGTLNPATNMCE